MRHIGIQRHLLLENMFRMMMTTYFPSVMKNLISGSRQIIYFFASLCFVAVGVLDLIIEKHYLHSLMILAGLFGVLSAVFVESDIHLSNVFSVVSVCLFFFEAAFVFLRRKHAITEGQAISMRRALLLGDLCFVLAAIFDIIVSIFPSFLLLTCSSQQI